MIKTQVPAQLPHTEFQDITKQHKIHVVDLKKINIKPLQIIEWHFPNESRNAGLFRDSDTSQATLHTNQILYLTAISHCQIRKPLPHQAGQWKFKRNRHFLCRYLKLLTHGNSSRIYINSPVAGPYFGATPDKPGHGTDEGTRTPKTFVART